MFGKISVTSGDGSGAQVGVQTGRHSPIKISVTSGDGSGAQVGVQTGRHSPIKISVTSGDGSGAQVGVQTGRHSPIKTDLSTTDTQVGPGGLQSPSTVSASSSPDRSCDGTKTDRDILCGWVWKRQDSVPNTDERCRNS
ncbi:hypothetical protein ScPMuIL_002607 [Solemya velum]